MKGLNVPEPTTPAGTPAAGRPFPAIRLRLADAVDGRVRCEECGTAYDPDADRCPTCAQRVRRGGGGLETVIDTWGGDRPWTTLERSDALDGTRDTAVADDEAEGWPW
jgi:hypothetical protein